MTPSTRSVRPLRRQIRQWRRGRASLQLGDIATDAYIALFASVMIVAMGVNALRQLRVQVTNVCTNPDCVSAQIMVTWLTGLATLTAALAIARFIGPVFVSPAEAAWLLAAPVDRGPALRPRLWTALSVSVFTGGATGAAIGIFATSDALVAVLVATTICAFVLTGTAVACLDQIYDGHTTAAMTWVLGTVVWLGLLIGSAGWPDARNVSAPGSVSGSVPGTVSLAPAVAALLIVAVVAAISIGWASRRLGSLARTRLADHGAVASSLSGSLMGLNFALLYDVVIEKTWRARAIVRPARGRGGGLQNLVHRDVIRLKRAPARLVILLATLVVPYFAATLGIGSAVTVVGALTVFLAGIGLCSGLRVLIRHPGLTRCMPFSPTRIRAAGILVPTVLLIGWGAAAGPAIHQAMSATSWADAFALGVCTGAAGLAGAIRWIAAVPPDYGRPMLSTPMGAVPPSLYGALFRGFDAVLLATIPMLLADPPAAVVISVTLATAIIIVTIRRDVT